MNTVILNGTVAGTPKVGTASTGGRYLEMQVVTDMGDRVISHRVVVIDEFLAQSLHGVAKEGFAVSVQGELDYDSSGAFIAVPAKRACDVRPVSGAPAIRPEVVAKSVEVAQGPRTESQPAKVTVQPDPVQPAAEAAVEQPAVEEKAAVVVEEAEKPSIESSTPAAPAFVRGGFGQRPMPQGAPTLPRTGATGGSKFGAIGRVHAEDPDDRPEISEPGSSATEPPQRSAFARTFTQRAPAVPSVGADDLDGEIPF